MDEAKSGADVWIPEDEVLVVGRGEVEYDDGSRSEVIDCRLKRFGVKSVSGKEVGLVSICIQGSYHPHRLSELAGSDWLYHDIKCRLVLDAHLRFVEGKEALFDDLPKNETYSWVFASHFEHRLHEWQELEPLRLKYCDTALCAIRVATRAVMRASFSVCALEKKFDFIARYMPWTGSQFLFDEEPLKKALLVTSPFQNIEKSISVKKPQLAKSKTFEQRETKWLKALESCELSLQKGERVANAALQLREEARRRHLRLNDEAPLRKVQALFDSVLELKARAPTLSSRGRQLQDRLTQLYSTIGQHSNAEATVSTVVKTAPEHLAAILPKGEHFLVCNSKAVFLLRRHTTPEILVAAHKMNTIADGLTAPHREKLIFEMDQAFYRESKLGQRVEVRHNKKWKAGALIETDQNNYIVAVLPSTAPIRLECSGLGLPYTQADKSLIRPERPRLATTRSPRAFCALPTGEVILIDGHCLRIFSADLTRLTTLAGSAADRGYLDTHTDKKKRSVQNELFSDPIALVLVADDTLIVSDSGNAALRIVSLSYDKNKTKLRSVSTLIGGAPSDTPQDTELEVVPTQQNGKKRIITKAATLHCPGALIASRGAFAILPLGPITSITAVQPVDFSRVDGLVFADGHSIRFVSYPQGVVYTLAGSALRKGTSDGACTRRGASFYSPSGLAWFDQGTLYRRPHGILVFDQKNHRVCIIREDDALEQSAIAFDSKVESLVDAHAARVAAARAIGNDPPEFVVPKWNSALTPQQYRSVANCVTLMRNFKKFISEPVMPIDEFSVTAPRAPVILNDESIAFLDGTLFHSDANTTRVLSIAGPAVRQRAAANYAATASALEVATEDLITAVRRLDTAAAEATALVQIVRNDLNSAILQDLSQAWRATHMTKDSAYIMIQCCPLLQDLPMLKPLLKKKGGNDLALRARCSLSHYPIKKADIEALTELAPDNVNEVVVIALLTNPALDIDLGDLVPLLAKVTSYAPGPLRDAVAAYCIKNSAPHRLDDSISKLDALCGYFSSFAGDDTLLSIMRWALLAALESLFNDDAPTFLRWFRRGLPHVNAFIKDACRQVATAVAESLGPRAFHILISAREEGDLCQTPDRSAIYAIIVKLLSQDPHIKSEATSALDYLSTVKRARVWLALVKWSRTQDHDEMWWQALGPIVRNVEQKFQEANEAIMSLRASPSLISTLYGLVGKQVDLSCIIDKPTLIKNVDDLNFVTAEVARYQQTLSTLASDSNLYAECISLSGSPLCELFDFIEMKIPSIMRTSIQWLHLLCKSSLFVQTQWEVDIDLEIAIDKAASKWSLLFESLDNGSIKLKQIENLFEYLARDDIELLYRTKDPYKVAEAGQAKLVIWRVNIEKALKKFSFLLRLRAHIDELYELLDLLVVLCRSSEAAQSHKETLQICQHSVTLGWDDLVLNDIGLNNTKGSVAQALSNCSEKLLDLDGSVIGLIVKNPSFVAFVSSLPREDKDFNNLIEIALNLPELEVPAELWLSAESRVDESILSSLSSIRSYLLPLIDTPNSQIHFHDVNGALEQFHVLGAPPANFSTAFASCLEVQLALIELLSDDRDETSAPNRLLNFFSAEYQATWIIDASVQLEWTMHRKTSKISKRASLVELREFANNIALSSAASKQIRETIQRFLKQITFVSRLASLRSQLSSEGHALSPLSVRILDADDILAELVQTAQTQLQETLHALRIARRKYASLNYLSQPALQTEKTHSLPSDVFHVNKNEIILIDTSAIALSTRLETLGSLLDGKLRTIYPVFSPSSPFDHGCYWLESPTDVYTCLLSAIYRHGAIQLTRHNIHIVESSRQSFEQFLLRWRLDSSIAFGVYALVIATNEIDWRNLSHLLDELAPDASRRPPLLIITEENDSSPLRTFLNVRRITLPTVPETELRAWIGSELLTEDAVRVFASERPGQGKTFAVRTMASQKNYKKIAIFNEACLLSALSEVNDGVLHFDVSHSGFIHAAFKILFLRSLDGFWAWNPKQLTIAIEIHTNDVSFYQLLPQHEILKPDEGLVVSRSGLQYALADKAQEVHEKYKIVTSLLAQAHDFSDAHDGDCDDGALAYALLQRYTTSHCTYRQLTAFVSQLSTLLRVLATAKTIASAACLKDSGQGYDSALASQSLRIGLIELCATTVSKSLNFCIAHQVLTVSGFSSQALNGIYQQMPYKIHGEPTYRRESGDILLYAQVFKSTKRWTFDTVYRIQETGDEQDSGLARSRPYMKILPPPTKAQDWTSSTEWKASDFVEAWLGGHDDSTLEFRGIVSKLTGADGILRFNKVAPKSRHAIIGGRPRYQTKIRGINRLHVFYSLKKMKWIMSSTSDECESIYYQSKTSALTEEWSMLKSAKVENGVQIKSQEELNEDVVQTDVKWERSNYMAVLLANDEKSTSSYEQPAMAVVALNRKIRLHPMIERTLSLNHIEDFRLDRTESNRYAALALVTGIQRSAEYARGVLGKYVLTQDNLMKMHKIFARLHSLQPCVCIGEAGVGKTALLNVLSKWCGMSLHILDVDGGTTDTQIKAIVKQAIESSQMTGDEGSLIFFDEANTCDHLALINDLLTNRCLDDEALPDNIYLAVAVNPVRTRSKPATFTPGFAYRQSGRDLADLVYRVNPLPAAMAVESFDFGSLSLKTEETYILNMVQSARKWSMLETRSAASAIVACSNTLREIEGDVSAVSLRDVRRALDFIVVFEKLGVKMYDDYQCTILALLHAYYFRIASDTGRSDLLDAIAMAIQTARGRDDTGDIKGANIALGRFIVKSSMLALLNDAKSRLCKRFDLFPGVALNENLKENLYALTICVLARVPIFIIGKPGSSKNLSIAILQGNMIGPNSRRKMWSKLPAIHIFQFQCSPLTTSEAIRKQYEVAVSFQARNTAARVVLLLDEVGLAEFSPHKPLKNLHSMLAPSKKSTIAIVGLSNWSLDASKMNRAICLARPDPNEHDLIATGEAILDATSTQPLAAVIEDTPTTQKVPPMPPKLRRSSSIKRAWLPHIARSYHSVTHEQSDERHFYGLRDFYEICKLLARSRHLTIRSLDHAVARCFGGNMKTADANRRIFFQNVFGDDKHMPGEAPNTLHLCAAALRDTSARHLMLLTRDLSCLAIALGKGLLRMNTTEILFHGAHTEQSMVVESINRVKIAMATGRTLVLVNADAIYESLYDLLNQRYVVRRFNTGEEVRMARLTLGSKSQLCQVSPSFRLLVVVEEEQALKELDSAFLNRFEKIVLNPMTILDLRSKILVEKVVEWTESIASEVRLPLWKCFPGLISKEPMTIASLIQALISYDSKNLDDSIESLAQARLRELAHPIAVSRSQLLYNDKYFQDRSSGLHNLIQLKSPQGQPLVVLTLSADLPAEDKAISIGAVVDEQVVRREIAAYLQDSNQNYFLILHVNPAMLQQVCYLVDIVLASSSKKRTVAVLVTVREDKPMIFRPLPWTYHFIDDVRGSCKVEESLVDTAFLNDECLDRCLTSAVALTFSGTTNTQGVDEFALRLSNARFLLRSTAASLVRDGILDILRAAPMGYHIDLALNSLNIGSLRQSMSLVFDTLVARAFACILANVDSFHNLSLLVDETSIAQGCEESKEDVPSIWWYLAQTVREFDAATFAIRTLRGDAAVIQPRRGPYAAAYPFSIQILAFYENARQALHRDSKFFENDEADDFIARSDALTALVKSKFVADEVKRVLLEFEAGSLLLVEDYVSFTLLRSQYDELHDVLTQLYKITATQWCSKSKRRPTCTNLIAAAWACEDTIKRVRSLWNACNVAAASHCVTAISNELSQQCDDVASALLEITARSMMEFCQTETARLALTSEGVSSMWVTTLVHVQNELPLNFAAKLQVDLLFSDILVTTKYIPQNDLILKLRDLHDSDNFEQLATICGAEPELGETLFVGMCEIALAKNKHLETICDLVFDQSRLPSSYNTVRRTITAGLLSYSQNEVIWQKLAQWCYLSPAIQENKLFRVLVELHEDLDLDIEHFPDQLSQDLEYYKKQRNLVTLATQHVVDFMDDHEERLTTRLQDRIQQLSKNMSWSVSKNKREMLNELFHAVYLRCGLYGTAVAVCAIKPNITMDDAPLLSGLIEYQENLSVNSIDGFAMSCPNSVRGVVMVHVRRACADEEDITKALIKIRETLAPESSQELSKIALSVAIEQEYDTKNFLTNVELCSWLETYFDKSQERQIVFDWMGAISKMKSVHKHMPALATHVLHVALHAQSWLYNFIFRPEDYVRRRCYLPTMEAESFMLDKVMGVLQAEYVQWYTCVRGHLYSVGECGRPMQAGRCPTCGSAIGGESHVPRPGNTVIGSGAALRKVRKDMTRDNSKQKCVGYISACTKYYALTSTKKAEALSPICVRFIRLVIHLSLTISKEAWAQVSEPHAKKRDVFDRALSDFDALCACLPELKMKDVALRCHLALQKLTEFNRVHVSNAWMPTIEARDIVAEAIMNQCVDPAFDLKSDELNSIGNSMQEVDTKFRQGLIHALGSDRFKQIVNPKLQSTSLIYRPRRFKPDREALRSMAQRTNSFETRYPLTAAVLDDHNQVFRAGAQLMIVIEWLCIVRRALIAKEEPLTREQASDLRNEHALSFLASDERERATQVLSSFCDIFNAILPQITNLYECQRNPFVVRNPVSAKLEVDLSASADFAARVPMSFQASLIFSLPAPPSMGEAVDAPCLCLIAIIRHLETLHNSAFGRDEKETILSLSTQSAEIKRTLIQDYDLSKNDIIIKTLVECNTAATLEDAEIRLDDVERNLKRRLLRGARPIQLCIPSYSFLGTASSRGSLALLNTAIPQRRHLSPELRQAVVEHCSSRHRLIPLISFLEHAVRVLAAVGGSASASLSVFAVEVLRIDSTEVEAWGLTQASSLADISNLLLLAEAILTSSGQEAMSRLCAPFAGADLDNASSTLISKAAECIQRPTQLLETLHDLLTGPLSDPDATFDPEAPLKSFLEYQDTDLLDANDFQTYFPPQLRLHQALAVYNHLQGLRLGGGNTPTT